MCQHLSQPAADTGFRLQADAYDCFVQSILVSSASSIATVSVCVTDESVLVRVGPDASDWAEQHFPQQMTLVRTVLCSLKVHRHFLHAQLSQEHPLSCQGMLLTNCESVSRSTSCCSTAASSASTSCTFSADAVRGMRSAVENAGTNSICQALMLSNIEDLDLGIIASGEVKPAELDWRFKTVSDGNFSVNTHASG